MQNNPMRPGQLSHSSRLSHVCDEQLRATKIAESRSLTYAY